MATVPVVAAAQAYVSIPVAHRRMGQNSPLQTITRDGAPVRIGDILSGHANGQEGLVDRESDPFDDRPQEKIGFVVALGDFRKMLQRRHVIMQNGKPTPNSRRNVAVNAAQCLLDSVEQEGAIMVTVQGSLITIGRGGLLPHDLLLEGLRPDGKSYALQLAIPTPAPAGPPPTFSATTSTQDTHNPLPAYDQALPHTTLPPPNGMSTSAAAASPGSLPGTSAQGGGPTRPTIARARAHPYVPSPRHPPTSERVFLSGRRGFSLPSHSMMRLLQSSFADPFPGYAEFAASMVSTIPQAGPSSPPGSLSGGSGRHSSGVHRPFDVGNARDGLGSHDPASALPPLSTSPEPIEQPYEGIPSDGSVASPSQSTWFSDTHSMYSPTSSPGPEANYTYSPAADPLYPTGSAETIPRSMTYPPYRKRSFDNLFYRNMDSNYGFQG